jgi:hypothetical protein
MAKHIVRLLIDQTSGFVVWLSYNFESYPPIVDPRLNYHTFRGNTEIDLLDSFSNYKLYYSAQTTKFSTSDMLLTDSEEFISAQLLRAKAIALYHAIRIVKSKYDSLDLVNVNLYRSLEQVKDKNNPWVQVYQKEHNCSGDNALKLIKFHVAEHRTAIFNLESALLMFKNRVKSVNTLEDLSTEYNIYCSKTMSVPFNLTD